MAVIPEIYEQILKDCFWEYKFDEEKIRNRMMRNAEMVQNRGLDAILCLMARGVGEDTATRILRAYPPESERDSLLKAIHEAEVQYARTRRFWG